MRREWRLRRLQQVLIGTIALCALLEAALSAWLWATMLVVLLMANVMGYVVLRRVQDQLADIEAHHEWLRWKANQQ